MRRLTVCALAALVVSCAARSREERAEEGAYATLMKEFREKMDPAEKRGDSKAIQETLRLYAPKFLAFAENNPTDEMAVEALQFVLGTAQGPTLEKDGPPARALALLR